MAVHTPRSVRPRLTLLAVLTGVTLASGAPGASRCVQPQALFPDATCAFDRTYQDARGTRRTITVAYDPRTAPSSVDIPAILLTFVPSDGRSPVLLSTRPTSRKALAWTGDPHVDGRVLVQVVSVGSSAYSVSSSVLAGGTATFDVAWHKNGSFPNVRVRP